jgi:hypothetical protein
MPYIDFFYPARLEISPKAQIPINIYVKITFTLRLFQKTLTCPNQIKNTLDMEEKCIFLG